MKKIIALLLVFVMVAALAACTSGNTESTKSTTTTAPSASASESTGTTEPEVTEPEVTEPEFDPAVKSEGVMTYAEYAAAELDTEVTVETFVQATQGWYEKDGQGVITVYTQDLDGGYFLYNMPCSEEDAAKLTVGTRIRVTGFKAEYKGEIEIIDISSLEILDGEYIAYPEDMTSLLSNEEELIKYQNMMVSFSGLVVEAIEYKNGEPGDDIYITLSQGENQFQFCVEYYLTGADHDVYKMFTEGHINVGDTVLVEGFLYWYDGVNTHITGITNRIR